MRELSLQEVNYISGAADKPLTSISVYDAVKWATSLFAGWELGHTAATLYTTPIAGYNVVGPTLGVAGAVVGALGSLGAFKAIQNYALPLVD